MMYERTVVIVALIAFVFVMRWSGGDSTSPAPGTQSSGAAVFDIPALRSAATVPAIAPTTSTAVTRPALVEEWPRPAANPDGPGRDPAAGTRAMRRWASEATSMTWFAFYLPDRRLYAEEPCLGRDNPRPSFLWPASVQLAALAAAAKLEPDVYLPPLREYLQTLRTYRSEVNGVVGLEVLPNNHPSDRYYDDNA